MRGLRATSSLRPPPDFLVVGAQRCGTTSLFRALSAHPAVLPPALSIKGVHYFDSHYDQPLSWYLAHFPTARTRRAATRRAGATAVTGEASPYYVFHPAIPGRIARDVPGARVVLLLRDPVARAYSHYQHMVWEGLETAGSFEEAIDLEGDRLQGEEERLLADPAYTSPHHQHHSYVARGRYGQQLARLRAHFPEEQVLVVDSHRLFVDAQAEVARVLAFLGLPEHPAVDLRSLNGGAYEPPSGATVQRLRDHYASDSEQLVEQLGWTPTWLA